MAITLSPKIRSKLANKTPPVTIDEIQQCFANRKCGYLLDTREEHRSDPPTRWFISETDYGRLLKIAFIVEDGGNVVIRTAYNPNKDEIRIYNKFSC